MKKILFKPEMVRDILSGRKTQTRRIHSDMSKPKFNVGEIVYVGESYLPCYRGSNPKEEWAIYTDDMNYRAFAGYKWRRRKALIISVNFGNIWTTVMTGR